MTDQNDQTGTPDEPQQDDLPTATDDGTEALSDARPVAADEDYAEIYAGEDAGADDEAAVDEGEGGDDDLSAEEPGDETGDEPADAQSAAAAPGEAPGAAPKSSGGERIAKVMARAGIASRREAERMIVEGRVRVNGDAITSPALDILPTDKVVVDGKPMDAPQETRMWLYYKPVGLVTSESDEKGRQTVFEALPRDLPRVMSVGRLDITSEGLLLLTNDGELKRRLELPATGWLRRYRVRVNGNPSELTFDPLRRGATIDGEEFQPMEIKLDSQKGANAWLTVGIREGRNREIRRAMAHVGLQVNRLIRIAYGPFRLVGMEENEVREVKRRILKDQLGGLLTGDSDEEPRAATRGRRDGDRGARPARGDRPERGDRGDRGDRGERAPRGDRPAFDNRDSDGPRKPRAPRAEGGGGYDRKPREGAGGFDRKPRAEGPGGYDRKPRAEGAGGGYDRKPRAEGAGGYGRKPRAEGAGGGYERKPRDGAGGYSRGPRPEGAGGYDRKPRPVGEQGEQPRKPRWKGSEGGDRGAGGQGRPRAEGQGDSRPPRAAGGERGKPAYGDRPGFGGKPAGDRPSAGKPYGGKPGGGGRGKPFGGKPGDERPGGKPGGGKPGGGRPGAKPFGGKPGGARPVGRGPRPGGAPTGPRGPGGGSRER